MAGDLVAARAVRARRRRGVGQDVRDGRARRVPGARRVREARRRRAGRVARQRALPDVHEQGDREPAAADPPRARGPAARGGRRARDHELPRLRGAAALALRHARGHRAGSARALPRATHGAVRAGHGPDDVRAREDREPGRRDRQHPAARRSGVEPSAHAGGDHRVQRGAAGAAAGAPFRPRVSLVAGTDRARARRRDLPAAEARPGRDRLRRPDLAGAQGGRGAPAGGGRVPAAVRRRAARRVPGHRRRAGEADRGRVRRRTSGDGRGRPRPEHLRVARRQPVQPPGLPGAVPARRRLPVHAAAALHELPLGRLDPGGGRRRDLEAPRSSSGPIPTSGWSRGSRTARARCTSRGSPTSGGRRSGSPSTSSSCTRAARSGPTSPCSAARAGCSSRCSRRSRNGRSPRRSWGSPGCCGSPRSSRCWRTRARSATRSRAWRSPRSCSGPGTASATRTSRAWRRSPR